MPTVKLSRSECSRGLLPSVCMRCGAPADSRKSRTFSWFPPIAYIGLLAGLLPFVIIALVLTKRMAVSVPLCHEHRGHWSSRTTITVVSLLALLLMGVGFLVYSGNQPAGQGDLTDVFCLGWVTGLVAWVILVAILQAGSIRATEITERTVKLTGVNDGFIVALEEDRERDRDDGRERRRRYDDVRDDYDDEVDEPPPRRSRPRDDDYDDDHPRRRAWDR